jgi:hypothetical protein
MCLGNQGTSFSSRIRVFLRGESQRGGERPLVSLGFLSDLRDEFVDVRLAHLTIEVKVDLKAIYSAETTVRRADQRTAHRELVGRDSMWFRFTSYFQKYPKMP